MRYEIEKEGIIKIFDIEKQEKGYWIKECSAAGDILKEHHIEVENIGNIRNILVQGKSFDVGVVAHKDYLEVEVVGERHLLNVYDPRKKALKILGADGDGVIKTQMPGRIIEVCVAQAQAVRKGDIVVIVEAMKMENPLKATKDGIVSDIFVEAGDLVEAKTKLLQISDGDVT